MRMHHAFIPVLGILAMALAGCESTSGSAASPAQNTELLNSSQVALQKMTAQDPNLQDLINSSYGYVIFPEVGKAAAGIGAAGGKGIVYQNGHPVGTVTMDQIGVGPQIGGETYSELIVFQNQQALNRLMNNSLEFGADAHATLVKAGAAAATQFDNGVKVFVLPKGGLMAGADIHGQKFTFHPNSNM